jgi:hypothetical protein
MTSRQVPLWLAKCIVSPSMSAVNCGKAFSQRSHARQSKEETQ